MEIVQPGGSGELIVGVTEISGGTTGLFLYDNNGVLGEVAGLTKALADTYYYPLSTNPAGYLTSGDLPSSLWTEASGTLYPATTTDRILIGGATDDTTSALQVNGASYFEGTDIEPITTFKVNATGGYNTGFRMINSLSGYSDNDWWIGVTNSANGSLTGNNFFIEDRTKVGVRADNGYSFYMDDNGVLNLTQGLQVNGKTTGYAINATGAINTDQATTAPATQTLLALPLNVFGAGTITDILGDPDNWITIYISGVAYKIPAYLA
jgi:hypothetical protein